MRLAASSVALAVLIGIALLPTAARPFEGLDVVSGVLESPRFKGKDPIQNLRSAAELLRTRRLKHSEISFVLLDWTDQYLREPADQMERLKRWADLTSDEKLSHLKLPREYLNRILLAEYLVKQPAAVQGTPYKKMEVLARLGEKNLVDWSVALSYSRLLAGGILIGAKEWDPKPPLQSLEALKILQEQGLVDWHYRVPVEAILLAETLALDAEFGKGAPYEKLLKLRDLEKQGLLTALNRKELERLPAWKLLVGDPSFLKADPAGKKNAITRLKQDGVITQSTWSELVKVFRPSDLVSSEEPAPSPLPEDRPAPAR